MTGCSTITDGFALECFRTLEEIHKSRISLNRGEIDNKSRKLFDQIVSKFLEEIYLSSSCIRPFPPMLGDGAPIDLLTLYLCVREHGGYESVSENGAWDLIAREIGYESSVCGSLKVVYVKYLELLDAWFSKAVNDNDLGNGEFCSNNVEMKILDSRKLSSDIEMKDHKEFVGTSDTKPGSDSDLQSCVGSVEGLNAKDGLVIELDGGTNEENESIRKRKRERYLPLLDWVKKVSKDPCDPAIGSLPEKSKWMFCGREHLWKQVLSAREAMQLDMHVDPRVKQNWQKNLRMHPSLYDDRRERSTSRCSQRIISAKEVRPIIVPKKPPKKPPSPHDSSESSSSGLPKNQEDEDSFWGWTIKQTRTPLGRAFQAKIPEWTEQTYDPDTKWLGIPIWPLDKTEIRSSLIELERVGKGRQDSCGCQFPGSLECVRFHVSQKRSRLKLELGSAFLKWEFDKMGESIACDWTRKEEKKFEDIIKSTPSSSGTSFWDELSKHFKNKKMGTMVSYYFNVYLFRRRAHQNRSDPSNIDSDDDELEKIANEENKNAAASILCSPKKKVRLNVG